MASIRLVAFLEHLSEILSEKRQFGEHTRPGCGARRPRRSRGSVGSKADNASRANVRRGFLDIYAGARYNYFGITIDASIDDAGVQEVSDDAAQRTFRAVRARVQSAVDAEAQRLRVQAADERAVLREDVRVEEAILLEDVRVEEAVLREDVRVQETILREDVRSRIAASLEPDLLARLRRDLARSPRLREAVRNEDIPRITKGVRSEFRALLNAVLDARLVEDRARVDARLGEDRARVDARFAEGRARLDARVAQARTNAQARVAQAKEKFSKALAKELEDHLPTSKSNDDWWVDPIVGLRGQINFTRCSFWHSRGMSADLGLALKSPGSPAARLASISRATFSWRQAIAISTWITQRTAWFTMPRNPDSSRVSA